MHPTLVIRPFRVVEIKWETLDIFTLVVHPEDPAQQVAFAAGQWVYLHAIRPDGTTTGRSAFSIASAPHESGEALEFGIRVHGPVTTFLSKVQPDDLVGIQGPFGVFTLKEDLAPQVYIAGGIGISPLRSMIREMLHRHPDADVRLLYSTKTIEDMAYYFEFKKLAEACPRFSFQPFLTREVPAIWEGGRGRIGAEHLRAAIGASFAGDICMCGPNAFMDDIDAALQGLGIEPKSRIRRESFGT